MRGAAAILLFLGCSSDAKIMCPSAVKDPLAAQRQACGFAAGDVPESRKFPIEHILVVMKENRSFDHLLGGIGAL